MSDSTQDPIMLLRDAVQALINDAVELANSGDAGYFDPEKQEAVIQGRAALKAAEQRETVPAGKWEVSQCGMYMRKVSTNPAAPVPEAKAEELGYEVFFDGGWKPASAQAYFCSSEKNRRLTAPAVKHEASELPPLPESNWILAGSANNRDAYTADQMRAYGQACIDSRSPVAAAPIPTVMDQKAIEDLGHGLAIEAVSKHNVSTFSVSSQLSIDRPESIRNFNQFGVMLAEAYLKGAGQLNTEVEITQGKTKK